MDALAQGYGTDSSAGSSNNSPKKASTLGLLANYSDDSDAEGEIETSSAPIEATSRGTDDIHPNQAIEHAEKKRRILNADNDMSGLPLPKLLQSTTKDANADDDNSPRGILFRKNYVYLQNKLQYKTENKNQNLCEKLKQLQQNQTSFSQQLKSQKEFGNPHMFPSVIEHFGIDPMESNIGGIKERSFEGFEFIERLLVKEEENRARQAQG